jgi:DNA gyrase inhibitor GyrI
MSNVEQPQYRVVEQHDNIELRDYPSMIVAEAQFTGTRSSAINAGFRTIADYIFGNNITAQKVAMTAPVLQQDSQQDSQQKPQRSPQQDSEQSSAKIAMTAPVTQQGDGNSWRVRFIMPSSYTMATLPTPKNPAVTLREIPGRRYAVIRFSGLAGDDNLRRHADELHAYLAGRQMTAVGAPSYAFYNPPWTLPFMRRNEVLLELGDSAAPPAGATPAGN